MSQAYVHVRDLDEAAKPYKRVWRCPATGIFVKTHAVRREVGYGRLKWDITGSLCDETGRALTDADGQPLIHVEAHGLSVQTDAGLKHADARRLLEELLADDGPETAARVKRQARALMQAPPSIEETRQRLGEDFERELRFVVAKVERAELNRRAGLDLGGVKTPPAAQINW